MRQAQLARQVLPQTATGKDQDKGAPQQCCRFDMLSGAKMLRQFCLLVALGPGLQFGNLRNSLNIFIRNLDNLHAQSEQRQKDNECN
jgi:hypothetical protein